MIITLNFVVIALFCLRVFLKIRKGLSFALTLESILVLALGFVLVNSMFFIMLGTSNIISYDLPKVVGVYDKLVGNETASVKSVAVSDELNSKIVAKVVTIDEIDKKEVGLSSIAIKDRFPISQEVAAEKFFAKEKSSLGESLSVSRQYAIVGAPFAAAGRFGKTRGAAYIFERGNNQWRKKAKLIGTMPGSRYYATKRFGKSVDISADYAIVGSPLDDDKCSVTKTDFGGIAFEAPLDRDLIYDRLFERGYLDMENRITAKFQGRTDELKKDFPECLATDLSKISYVLKKSKKCDYAGAAFVFKRNGDDWVQQDILHAFDAVEGNKFGTSVAIWGSYAIVGTLGQRDSYEGFGSDLKTIEGKGGEAYIFKRNNDDHWVLQKKIMTLGNSESVAIDGDYAIVGGGGSAYIIKRDGTDWSIQTKLNAEDEVLRGESFELFGHSVAISGDYAIVGNSWDNFGDRSKVRSGSAYIFKRQEDNWQQQAKITAGYYGGSLDKFGESVSIFGDYVVVGAFTAEAKDHQGAGQTEHTKTMMAGAAYIFKREGESWTRQSRLVADDRAAYDEFGFAVSMGDGYALVGAHKDDEDIENSGSVYIFRTKF